MYYNNFLQIIYALIIHSIICLTTVKCVPGRGLESLLRRLNNADVAQIQRKCAQRMRENPVRKKEPAERVVNGQNTPGPYEFMAAFVLPSGVTNCGATFISYEHLLTARHCFAGVERGPLPLLKVAGVCNGVSAECAREDMIQVEYDLVIFPDGRRDHLDDFAIVQLKRRLDRSYYTRVGFICLPYASMAPTVGTIIGWGSTVRTATLTTKRLKRANGALDYNFNSMIIFRPSAALDQDAGAGDSGGPMFSTRDGASRNAMTLNGVIIGRCVPKDSVLLDVRYYTGDLCHLMGLCVERPLYPQPQMAFTSAIFTRERAAYPTVSAFRPISYAQSAELERYCSQQRVPRGTNPPFLGLFYRASDRRRVCAATLVTATHALTSVSCASAVRTIGLRNLRFMVGGACPDIGGDCDRVDMFAVEIEFVARTPSNTDMPFVHYLAIVQLKQPLQLGRTLGVACINHLPLPDNLNWPLLYGWMNDGYTRRLRAEQHKIFESGDLVWCPPTENATMCTQSLFPAANVNEGDYGGALMRSTNDGTQSFFVGLALFKFTAVGRLTANVYLRASRLPHILCGLFNYCPYGLKQMENPFFNLQFIT